MRSAGPSSPDRSAVHWDAAVEAEWVNTTCTCGNGDRSPNHYLACAKWVAVLPAHASKKGSS